MVEAEWDPFEELKAQAEELGVTDKELLKEMLLVRLLNERLAEAEAGQTVSWEESKRRMRQSLKDSQPSP